ncbi:unnamed protein product [marine sediment metagenome]|uniref:Uncharacterized protein n=1 Tax=marine sediment metagenome TaxID=412755 RepID=X1DAZ5_9ZZZZ
MKRFLMIIASCLFIVSCWGSTLESYGMGRLMYYSIEANVSPATVDKLENRFNVLLDETKDFATVTSAQTLALFNDMGVILAAEHANPYGLMGDLTELLGLAGAEYAPDGSMLSVRPMPRAVFAAFSRGWKNSKAELAGRA